MTDGRGFGALLILGAWTLGAAGGKLPPQAKAAVRALYPAAELLEVHRERERGVSYYEVVVRQQDDRIEIEVAPDGAVGEIETRVAIADAPEAVRNAILARTDGAAPRRVERHEIRGVPGGSSFVPVEPPRTVYEVVLEVDGVRQELLLGADGTALVADDDAAEEEGEDEEPDED